jgi:hypothetical protein
MVVGVEGPALHRTMRALLVGLHHALHDARYRRGVVVMATTLSTSGRKEVDE